MRWGIVNAPYLSYLFLFLDDSCGMWDAVEGVNSNPRPGKVLAFDWPLSYVDPRRQAGELEIELE